MNQPWIYMYSHLLTKVSAPQFNVFNLLIGENLLYNVVLISAVEQCESPICIRTYLPS